MLQKSTSNTLGSILEIAHSPSITGILMPLRRAHGEQLQGLCSPLQMELDSTSGNAQGCSRQVCENSGVGRSLNEGTLRR